MRKEHTDFVSWPVGFSFLSARGSTGQLSQICSEWRNINAMELPTSYGLNILYWGKLVTMNQSGPLAKVKVLGLATQTNPPVTETITKTIRFIFCKRGRGYKSLFIVPSNRGGVAWACVIGASLHRPTYRKDELCIFLTSPY